MLKTVAKVLMIFLLVAALLGAFDGSATDTAPDDEFSVGIVQDVSAGEFEDNGSGDGGGDGKCEDGLPGC